LEALTMSKNHSYVVISVLVTLLPKKGLTIERIYAGVRSGKIKSKPGPMFKGRPRRLIHVGSARKYFACVRDAIRKRRTTTNETTLHGKPLLPAQYLAKPPYNWDHAKLCRMEEAGVLTPQSLLALVPPDPAEKPVPPIETWVLRWTNFYRQKAVDDALDDETVEAPAEKKVCYQRKKVKAHNGKKVASTHEAMALLGINDRSYLDYLEAKGEITHKTATGTRRDGRASDVAFWRPLTKLKQIAKQRQAQKRDDYAAVFEPFETRDGKTRLRDRAVRELFKANGVDYPHDATVKKWCSRERGEGCHAISEVVDRVEVDSICSTRPKEMAWDMDQVIRIIAAYKKPADEYDKADYVMRKGGRYVPQLIAKKLVPASVLIGERKKNEEERLIRIESAADLPWRKDRDWYGKEQDVFSVDDLLNHEKCLHPKMEFDPPPTNGNGQDAPAATDDGQRAVMAQLEVIKSQMASNHSEVCDTLVSNHTAECEKLGAVAVKVEEVQHDVQSGTRKASPRYPFRKLTAEEVDHIAAALNCKASDAKDPDFFRQRQVMPHTLRREKLETRPNPKKRGWLLYVVGSVIRTLPHKFEDLLPQSSPLPAQGAYRA
jgi:hypothetical protein